MFLNWVPIYLSVTQQKIEKTVGLCFVWYAYKIACTYKS